MPTGPGPTGVNPKTLTWGDYTASNMGGGPARSGKMSTGPGPTGDYSRQRH